MKERILAIVITYYPDKELLHKNISSFINDVDHIIIWENMKIEEVQKYRLNFEDKVEYYCANENVGISKALNYAWQYAISHDYSFLLSMDQDSVWKSFHSFKQESLQFLKDKNAIVGPNTRNSSVVNKSQRFKLKQWIITSGMLVSVNTLNMIGGYNQNFKVDGVDIELCLRAKSKGINSYINEAAFLIQKYGTMNDMRFLGKKIHVQNYNAERIKNIFWDNIVLLRIYRNKETIKELLIFLKLVIVSSLFLKGNRSKKIINVFRGIKSGFEFPIKEYYKLNDYAK